MPIGISEWSGKTSTGGVGLSGGLYLLAYMLEWALLLGFGVCDVGLKYFELAPVISFNAFMSENNNSPLNWNIELNFDLHEAKQQEEPVQAPKIPARQIIGEKFPKILARIEILWCSLELHKYFEETLFTDRSNRQGFPMDVMKALGEIHAEHKQILKQKKMISEDVWDL